MARTELWVTRGALGAVAGAQLLFGTPASAGADGVNVTGEGDCDTLDVVVSGLGSSSVGVSEGTNYSVADACTVTSSNGVETGTGGVPTEQAEAASFYQTAPAAAAPDSLAAAGFVGNWVHTSQTLQDVIFIDISKLRFHTDRHWDGAVTEFSGAWYARSSTSKDWNHTSGDPYLNFMHTGQKSARTASASGAFHSDFVWCNFEPGQNFIMTTEITTFKDGGFGREYRQNRQCAGTHKATESHQSSTPPAEWCERYPGGQGC